MVRKAGNLREPHRIAHYLETLAGAYHTWYAKERVVPLGADDARRQEDAVARAARDPAPARSAARLRLNDAVRQVISNGLGLLGVTAPDRM